MADRRIAEKTGQGVGCFLSNYSWLDGLSFTGMRERYLEAFDAIRIDCLNGDKYKTGKVAPDGTPDPSIFLTPSDPVGIQVGTAITTLVRKGNHAPATEVSFRHLWGQTKREALGETTEAEPTALYETIKPALPLGLTFASATVSEGWSDWPTLPDLFPRSFPGVNTGRDGFLIDIDLDRLKTRMSDYFDAAVRHEEIARRYPGAMKTPPRFDARAGRERLRARGGPQEADFVRQAYRPFDNRWLYWEAGTNLLDRPRPEYRLHVFEGNLWLAANKREIQEFTHGNLIRHVGGWKLGNWGTHFFPLWLQDDDVEMGKEATSPRLNLSGAAQRYIERLGIRAEDLFHHVLSVFHDPAYRAANAGAFRMEWPRIPLSGWPDGDATDAAKTLTQSAARGRALAQLSTPTRRSPASLQAHYVRKSTLSPCPPRPTAAT